MADTITFVAVEVAGKPSASQLLHREDCWHLRDATWPEPVLRQAMAAELRSRRKCQHCLTQEAREAER